MILTNDCDETDGLLVFSLGARVCFDAAELTGIACTSPWVNQVGESGLTHILYGTELWSGGTGHNENDWSQPSPVVSASQAVYILHTHGSPILFSFISPLPPRTF